ncbi:glycosyltransferase [Paenibacillus lycopersici]|uniref:Glycosyltransferase n=1 Tax=Paenibacillus lycopersici TaxID=2704462 RepID=A0A6C0G1W2_9BACL|nr:glycosyltransferase [Paenibacillus lycopersici]
MRKVAHICTSGISYKILGDKLALLQQSGCEVTFISAGDHLDASVRGSFPFQWRDVPMSRTIRPLQDLASIWKLRKLLRSERYDIVHTHTAKAGLIGRVAARLAGVPIVLHTSHGLPFYEGQSKAAYTAYRLLERFAARFCDALASQNEEDAWALRKLAPWQPVYCEGNGVDLDKLDRLSAGALERLKPEDLKQAYGIRTDAPMLLMAARFEKVKDHDLLLDALASLKRRGALGWVTVLAGQGPLEADIRKRIETEGLDGDVAFIGHQSDLLPWQLMADAVTLTSEKEGIPRSLMEAMALGKPIVATDVLGTRELVASDRGGSPEATGELVPYRDGEKLADALARMMDEPARRARLGEAGRRRVERQFTEAKVVSRLLVMYEEIALRKRLTSSWRSRLQRFVKRGVDIAASLTLLALLSPVIALTALAVRAKLGSPVLFRQERPGRFGNPFYVRKFRTMTDAKDRHGNPLPDEVRLTAFGKLIRKLSLDELPQLLNVLSGEMSLIGPRPLLMEYLPLYTQDQARRHYVRPGITGLAQVNGRNALSWEDKFRMDVWYVEHYSLLLDLRIALKTVSKVLRSEGIQQEGHVTTTKFAGTRSSREAL